MTINPPQPPIKTFSIERSANVNEPINFTNILFPVDLSDTAPKIVPYVTAVAERFQPEIHLLFVARTLEHFSSVQVPRHMIEEFQNRVVEGAQAELNLFKEKYFNKFIAGTKTAVILGDISEEIINYVHTNNIDLIIMGTHGRKGLNKVFYGSIADRVIKSSEVPVLVVNPFKRKGYK